MIEFKTQLFILIAAVVLVVFCKICYKRFIMILEVKESELTIEQLIEINMYHLEKEQTENGESSRTEGKEKNVPVIDTSVTPEKEDSNEFTPITPNVCDITENNEPENLEATPENSSDAESADVPEQEDSLVFKPVMPNVCEIQENNEYADSEVTPGNSYGSNSNETEEEIGSVFVPVMPNISGSESILHVAYDKTKETTRHAVVNKQTESDDFSPIMPNV